MRPPVVTTVDFETEKIESRPVYPPIPVGVSIKNPGERKPTYWAWGHPTENNCDKGMATRALKEVWSGSTPVLFHHAKFDIDVAETHMGCKRLPWERIHDTLYLIFLADPHAPSLGLKPAAQRFLGMLPAEQQDVRQWLIDNDIVKKNDGKWGAYICKAPGKLVGKYADGDVIRTEKLFNHLYPLILSEGMGKAYDRERQLMPIFLDNERQGLRVDLNALEKDIPIYTGAKEKCEAWMRKRLGVKEFNFDSDVDMAEILDKQGIVTDWVLTKTGKKSTSKKNMTTDKFSDRKLASALGYRNRMVTCIGTFMEPWLEKGSKNNGYINPNWNQVRQSKDESRSKGTRTGRPSCEDPNLLNIPKSFYDRGDNYSHPSFINIPELPLVRRYALPDKGCQWLHRDYNQQELRILGHFEDGAILEAYKNNPSLDIHTYVQDEIRRLASRELDRVSVKTINFGKIYGQGLGSLAEKLQISVKEVKQLRDMQNKALPGLPDLEKKIKDMVKDDEPIVTWGGRQYYCEEEKFVEKFNRIMSFEYKLINYLVQGSAADATKEAIIRYNSAKRDSRFLVTVYDEINGCAPKPAAAREMKILRECMESVEFDVPMLSDGKIGSSWGNLTKFKEVR